MLTPIQRFMQQPAEVNNKDANNKNVLIHFWAGGLQKKKRIFSPN